METGGLSEPKDLEASCDTSFSKKTQPDSRVASEPTPSAGSAESMYGRWTLQPLGGLQTHSEGRIRTWVFKGL